MSSSSLTGIHDVSTFIAFSKSESRRISLVPSMRAAEQACRTSRPWWKDMGGGSLVVVVVVVLVWSLREGGGDEDEEEDASKG